MVNRRHPLPIRRPRMDRIYTDLSPEDKVYHHCTAFSMRQDEMHPGYAV